MPLDIKGERAPMTAETFLFIITGLYGQAAIDAILSDMSKEEKREEGLNEHTT